MQLCTLLSIKTGGCSEDCAYCAQSARYHTGVRAERLMNPEEVLEVAVALAKMVQRAFAWVQHGKGCAMGMRNLSRCSKLCGR